MSKTEQFELHPQLEEDSILVGNFSLCRLLLINDKQFPWFVLVPQRYGIQEVYQLNVKEQAELWLESNNLSQTIMKHFEGDKLNIAAIGNVVSQLHLHHVVRFKTDQLWPKPIWGQLPMSHYLDKELESLFGKIVPELAKIGLKSANN